MKKNNRGIRFGIKGKILIGSILINIIVCTVMGVAIYRFVQKSYVESAARNTLSICQIAARQLNGNLLSLLDVGADESYANTVMRDDMAVVAGSANISNIYTVGERNGSLVYLATPAANNISIGTSIG
ncbi:MAG: hypothetical protein J5959_15430, partial [Butyrivibrio sp.]|nr:hypothetical protein [Butyrivibrio sp.]